MSDDPWRIYYPLPDGATCTYCGAPATSWDHVRPIHWGGLDEPENMVPSCWPCNLRKGDQPADLWQLPKAEREQWVLTKGWLRSRDLPRDPADRHYALFCGRRIFVHHLGSVWWDPVTGQPHGWKYAQRKAAWGSDAMPYPVAQRRRYW